MLNLRLNLEKPHWELFVEDGWVETAMDSAQAVIPNAALSLKLI